MTSTTEVMATFTNDKGIKCRTFFGSAASANEWKAGVDHVAPGFISNWKLRPCKNDGSGN